MIFDKEHSAHLDCDSCPIRKEPNECADWTVKGTSLTGTKYGMYAGTRVINAFDRSIPSHVVVKTGVAVAIANINHK